MASEIAAKRYVRALFEVAADQGQEDVTLAILEGLQSAYRTMPELRHALCNPGIPNPQKRAVLLGLVGEEAPAPVREFVGLLVDKFRVEVLQSAATLMSQLIDDARHVRHGVVRSAVPLTAEQLDKLREVLRETTNCEVILQTEVKPEIIGGLEVRIGDMLLDGSLRMRLENVRYHFQRERELAARGLSG